MCERVRATKATTVTRVRATQDPEIRHLHCGGMVIRYIGLPPAAGWWLLGRLGAEIQPTPDSTLSIPAYTSQDSLTNLLAPYLQRVTCLLSVGVVSTRTQMEVDDGRAEHSDSP